MTSNIDTSNRLALDAHSLDALRLQAKKNPEQALKATAQQFEAVFLNTLLKSMRDATPQDGLMDSEQTRMYTSMLDQQVAQSLSSRGIGLAKVMLQQLSRNMSMDSTAIDKAANAAVTADSSVDALAWLPPLADSALAGVPANALESTVAEKGSNSPMAVDFISRLKEPALEASKATGIPAQYLLGQAALESGWGKREIIGADGTQSFNLFGIKAGASWKGNTVEVMTTEYVNGAPQKITQKFRAYDSYAESFQDYASLLQNNPRYNAVLKQTSSAGFAQGLQQAGYATDPRYAEKLLSVLNSAALRRTNNA